MDLYSYVVAYDSGFAPNPFFGCCSLATCKPRIRSTAKVGDWIIGCGSADQNKKQGGLLVYAMQVEEILTFDEYHVDERFQVKKPNLRGSRKQARGDNIYHKVDGERTQLNSYHSNSNGTPNPKHVGRDTGTNRVLIGSYFRYFGRGGPSLPEIRGRNGRLICHSGRNHSKFYGNDEVDSALINQFIGWFDSLGDSGYVSDPYDWSDSR